MRERERDEGITGRTTNDVNVVLIYEILPKK